MTQPEADKDDAESTVAEAIRLHIVGLAPGTELDPGELAEAFGVKKVYVQRLLRELTNTTVCHIGHGQYTRMALDLTDTDRPGEVVRSLRDSAVTQSDVSGGKATHTTHIRTRHTVRT